MASQEANQDPIDLAFLAAAKERHIFANLPKVTPVSFAPFDAKNRRTEAVVEQSGQRLRVMKGAVRTIAEVCGLKAPGNRGVEGRVSASAGKGYRALAMARGPETGTPALLGLVTLYDPPRPDAKQLIAELGDLGVPVKMLTGDALPVRAGIGRGSGCPTSAIFRTEGGTRLRPATRRLIFSRAPTVSRRYFPRTNTPWCSTCRLRGT